MNSDEKRGIATEIEALAELGRRYADRSSYLRQVAIAARLRAEAAEAEVAEAEAAEAEVDDND